MTAMTSHTAEVIRRRNTRNPASVLMTLRKVPLAKIATE